MRAIFTRIRVGSIRSVITPLLLGLLQASGLSAQPCKEIVGYYPNWQWYDRNKAVRPQTIAYEKYTVLNYCFFIPKADGSIGSNDQWADDNLLLGEQDWSNGGRRKPETAITYIARSRGVKVLASVGGWTLSSTFPGIAADSALRRTFAASCVDLVRTYGFDGIDINWEFPGYTPHNGTAADKRNFTLLMQEIRKALTTYGTTKNATMLLTTAVGAAPERMDDVEWDSIANVVDIINVMTYDYYGTWDQTTNHNAPLKRPAVGAAEYNVESSIATLLGTYGVNPSKLTVGMAFYGRSAATVGVPGLHVPSRGLADLATFAADEGTPLYYNVLAALPNFTEHWDTTAQVPYLLGKPGLNTFVSYDNTESIRAKSRFAVDKGLRGAIIWEITGDYIETAPGSGVIASTPLVDAINDVFCTYTSSSTPRDTLAPVLRADRTCGTVTVTATELRNDPNPPRSQPLSTDQVDTGIASVVLGSTSADSNYRLVVLTQTPFPRDSSFKEVSFRLSVINPSKNARATYTVRDWAGNSVTDTVAYIAAPLSSNRTSINVGAIELGDSAAQNVVITNRSNAPVTITSTRLVYGSAFRLTPLTLPLTLQAGGTLTVGVTYRPRLQDVDTMPHRDTLRVETACSALWINLEGLGRVTCDSLSQPPRDTMVAPGSLVRFTVRHTPTRGLSYSYQWQTSLGVGWEDVVDAGQYVGANTTTLWISNVTTAQNRQKFRCAVKTDYCEVIGSSASLYVEPGTSVNDDISDITTMQEYNNKPYIVMDAVGQTLLQGIMSDPSSGERLLSDIRALPNGWYMVVIGGRPLAPIVVCR